MIYRVKKCPSCKEALIFPRGGSPYCEECGWPDEDLGGEYKYPKIGEELENYQPGLEFYTGKKWVESGLIYGRCSESIHGFYRYKSTAKLKKRCGK